MRTRTAALILAATGCAMATTALLLLLLLLLAPGAALIAAVAVYLLSDGLLRRARNVTLIALAVILAIAAQRHLTHRNGDPR